MDDPDASADPPDEAYGRVTRPERYAVLHDAARDLVDRLVLAHDVTRTDGTDLDPIAAAWWPGSAATTLTPAGGGAVVTVTWTAFPGLVVAHGFTGRTAFPSCGCDACDEDPTEEVDRLLDLVADVVAGGFTEERTHRTLRPDRFTAVLRSRDGGSESSERGDIDDAELHVPVGRHDWAPWLPR